MDVFVPPIKATLEELGISVVLARDGSVSKRLRRAWSDQCMTSHPFKPGFMAKFIRRSYKQRRSDVIGDCLNGRSWKSILTIGTSHADREALRGVLVERAQHVGESACAECRFKSVKLSTEPALFDITQQVRTLTRWLPMLACHHGDLDFDLDEDGVCELERRRLFFVAWSG